VKLLIVCALFQLVVLYCCKCAHRGGCIIMDHTHYKWRNDILSGVFDSMLPVLKITIKVYAI